MQSKPRDDEPALAKRMLEVARRRPRWGYRRVAWAAAAGGMESQRHAGLPPLASGGAESAGKKAEKATARAQSANGCVQRRAEHKDHVWCWDFVFDHTTSGSQLKWLSIVDEHTRECVALKVGRSITSEDVIDTLAELFAMRGVPRCIRSDNGPEFIAQAIRDWLARVDVETLYIEPGSPWENGYAESFHSRAPRRILGVGSV